MQVSDQLVNQMLRNLPQDQQDVMAGILTGEILHEVVCDSEDIYETIEENVRDEAGNPVYYKSGARKDQPKMQSVKKLVQEGTNGRVIAHISNQGQVIPTTDEKGRTWLRASRRRTDGEFGFECWCGRDSRIAPNELGVLFADGRQPSKEDLFQMAANLEKNPPQYATMNGERVVDGFIIREVRK